MKKIILLVILIISLTGCGDYTFENAKGDFTKQVENSKSYKLKGTMEINNDEEIYTYSLETYFLKDDYYKVILINQTNNHEQVILKNKDGLYVVTPNLNKSFKFDSVWPENSSQAYLLKNLVEDVKNDNEATLEETDNNYIIKSKVNYPNNDELKYQKIYFNKDLILEKVEVYSKDDVLKIKVNIKDLNLKAKLTEDDFLLEDLITEDNQNKNCENEENCKSNSTENCENGKCDSQSGATIESIIYPLYIPANTHLSNSETVSTGVGERVILTFSGDNNFVIVEEPVVSSEEMEIIPVFGDPLMLDNSIGALGSNSISWQANNVSYYLVGSDLSSKELVDIAKSLGNTKTVVSTK